MIWLLFVIVHVTQGQVCPLVICKKLDEGICSEMFTRPGLPVSLNSVPCKHGDCSILSIVDWYWETLDYNTTKLKRENFYCEDIEIEYKYRSNYDVDCPNRETGKEISNKTWPINCANSTDCLMDDGSYADCVCGIDRKSYCMPSYSTTIFDDFWKQCTKNDNTVDLRTWLVWDWYKSYYNLIMSVPTCGDDILIELNIGFILEGVMDSSLTIAVGCTVALSFLT